jgi:glutaminase
MMPRTSIIADYSIGQEPVAAQPAPARARYSCRHHEQVRVIELVGHAVLLPTSITSSRQLASRSRPQFVIFDLHRVTSADTGPGARLVAEEFLANLPRTTSQ